MKMSPLSTEATAHVGRVYGLLLAGVLGMVAGVEVNMRLNLAGLVSSLVAMGCAFYLYYSSNKVDRVTPKRLGVYGFFTMLTGASVSPLLKFARVMYPGLQETALFGSLAIFGCFTLAAVFARRRSWLFLGGALSSMTIFWSLMRLFNWYAGIALIHDMTLYFGLLTFLGYTLYDTQLMIEKFYAGQRDVVTHALELYIDFFHVFVKILVIMMDNQDRKRKSQR